MGGYINSIWGFRIQVFGDVMFRIGCWEFMIFFRRVHGLRVLGPWP